MKKDTLLATILQIFMSAVLIIFGILLKNGTNRSEALAFLMVPGIVIAISTVFNFFKFKSKYFFPVSSCTLCILGIIIVLAVTKVSISALLVLGLIACVGVTGLICTLFHWLHGEILK